MADAALVDVLDTRDELLINPYSCFFMQSLVLHDVIK